ncbi:unnamed protein product [Durusdinium trenchii]|uniref:Uncharacterized protein n=1 Tax=Durusdinium trenchii TaxID=1381693 RepID=A0ABP0QID9_9DINO
MAVSPEALNEIQAALKQANEGQLVQACHNLMAALTRHHLLRSSVLLPDEVACHPENRDGFGLSGHDVHALLHGLSEVGWDSRETNPICSEVGSNHADVLSFNQELVRSSGGLLPEVVPTSMRYASLAGSHTNAALRALRHEVKLPQDHGSGPLALEGKLSMARARSHDPQLYKAAEEGMIWRIVSKEAAAIEGVPQLIQAASNTSGHLQRGEHEWQILLRMKGMIERSTSPPEWAQVRKDVMRTKPACAEATPYMYQFLLKYMHKRLLAKIESRVKKNVSAKKVLGTEFFVNLSGTSKDWQAQHVWFRHALLGLAYNSEKLVGASDARRILSKEMSPAVAKAEGLMIKMQKLLDSVGIPEESAQQVQTCFDKFQDGLVLEVLEKRKDLTPQSMACEFMDELEEVLGKRLSTEFDAHRKHESSTPSAPAASPGPSVIPREYDEFGKIKEEAVLVREQGFVEGASVLRKKDKVRATIESLKGSKVKLSLDTEDVSGYFELSAGSFLRGEWKVVKKHVETTQYEFDTFSDHTALKSDAINLMCAKGEVARRFIELDQQHAKVLEGLKLQVKPSKAVFCTKPFAKNKLILIPSTWKIESKEASSGLSIGTIRDVPLSLLPAFLHSKDGDLTGSFLQPFWMVKRTHVLEDANCEIRPSLTDTENNSVKIPCMYNTCALKPKDELIVYTPQVKVEEEPEPLAPIAAPPPAKRARTKSKES